ncbi:hypothetical protein V6N12_024951 [Hibiscus sabdariffa]|uniref:Uncharacterized protein n=1 Tax=Hibiscus sabdariffa TaxID=183260 RepID=A0ABR2AV75_9ROSI
MVEPPLKPVLQKPPGYRDPNFPATQSGFRPPSRKPYVTKKPNGTYLDAAMTTRVEVKNPTVKMTYNYGDTKFDVSVEEGGDETPAGTTVVTGFTMGKQSTTSLKVETKASNMLGADDVGNRIWTGHRSKTLAVNVEAWTKVGPYLIVAAFFISLLFVLSLLSTSASQLLTIRVRRHPALFPNRPVSRTNTHYGPAPPSIAYLLSGYAGDSDRILRLLFASYHPRNHYLLHLDLSAPQTERDQLVVSILSVPIFRAAQNVDVIGKANYAYPRGFPRSLLRFTVPPFCYGCLRIGIGLSPSMLVITLLLLKMGVSYYRSKRLKPIIVGTGHYLLEKDEVFYVTRKRELPNAFKLFSGHGSNLEVIGSFLMVLSIHVGARVPVLNSSISIQLGPWFGESEWEAGEGDRVQHGCLWFTSYFEGSTFTMLTRTFIEFCILGTDNLPRTLLMYLANMPYPFTNYFPTILCNTDKFKRTVINHNLQYVASNVSSSKKPSFINSTEFDAMIQSGDAFATEFQFDNPVLDCIDRKLLKRKPGRVVPGGWCLGVLKNDTCSVWGDADILRPGPGAKGLKNVLLDYFQMIGFCPINV